MNRPNPTASGTSAATPASERRSIAALAMPVAVSVRPTRRTTPRRGSVRRSIAGTLTRGRVRLQRQVTESTSIGLVMPFSTTVRGSPVAISR